MPQEEPFLMHYGVLGMKWGVRKSKRELAADARADRKAEKRSRKSADRVTKKQNKADKKAAREKNKADYKAAIEKSRAEDRAFNALSPEKKQQVAEKKLNRILGELKETDLVQVRTRNGQSQVVTGKEFVNHLSVGGQIDIRMTDIWARDTGKGHELNKMQKYK